MTMSCASFGMRLLNAIPVSGRSFTCSSPPDSAAKRFLECIGKSLIGASGCGLFQAREPKNGEPNSILLNDLAIAELDRQARGNVWPRKGRIFATSTGAGFTGYAKGKKTLDSAIEAEQGDPLPAWRLHDLRRTLATNFQRLGVQFEVTEAVLNHVGGSRAGVAGVYQRHDWKHEKREALDDWNSHLEQILSASGSLRSESRSNSTGS